MYGDRIHGGDSYDKAIVTPTGKLFHLDHLQPAKGQDFFSLQVATLYLHAVDSDGVDLGNAQAPNPGAVAKLENLKLAKPGYVFVKVSYDHYGDKGLHSMAFGPGDVDSPPPPPKQ